MNLPRARALALFHRNQGLSSRGKDPVEMVERLIAVQTQYAQSLPVGIHARISHPEPTWAERELDVGGSLVKSWTIRSTLHTMTEPMFDLLQAAVGPEQQRRFKYWMHKRRGLSSDDVDRRHDRILAALQDGPLTRPELHAKVSELKGIPGAGWGVDVMGLAFEGRLVMCNHYGATTFVSRTPAQLGLEPDDALAKVLRLYLGAYGPATMADFKYWCMMYVPMVKRAFELASADIEWVSLNEDGKPTHAVLKDHLAQLDATPEPPIARLGSKFDVSLLGHVQKGLYLDMALRQRVFRKAGQIEAPIFVRGEVQGTWRMKQKSKSIEFTIEQWPRTWPKTVKSAIEKDAIHIASGFGFAKAELTFRSYDG